MIVISDWTPYVDVLGIVGDDAPPAMDIKVSELFDAAARKELVCQE